MLTLCDSRYAIFQVNLHLIFLRGNTSLSLVLWFAFKKIVIGSLLIGAVSLIAFFLLSAAGGDALTALSDNPQVSRETVDRLRSVYGLDQPVASRYLNWLGGLITGDLGESFIYRTSVLRLVLSRLCDTAVLAAGALAIALLIAIPGAYSIQRSKVRWLDSAADLIVSIAASTPRIVAALVALLTIVSLSASRATINVAGSPIVFLLAAGVLALPLVAALLAQAKGELGRASQLAFVQFARSKGLSERSALMRHAFREALNPILTIVGLSIGSLVSGSVVVETILGRHGIGSLTVAAVRGRDVPLVMGIVIVTTLAVWIGNSFAELLQILNDPRLRTDELNSAG